MGYKSRDKKIKKRRRIKERNRETEGGEKIIIVSRLITPFSVSKPESKSRLTDGGQIENYFNVMAQSRYLASVLQN
jgi:hypothetical protein